MNSNEEFLKETLNKYIDEYDRVKNQNAEIIKILKNIANGKIGKCSCAEEYAQEILKQNKYLELENEKNQQ
jgi:hypothetical protein